MSAWKENVPHDARFVFCRVACCVWPPGCRYASSMVRGLERKLRQRDGRPGQLDLLILTNGQMVGAVPQLLAAYPGMKVCAHLDEMRHLVHDPREPYTNTSSPTTLLKALG